MDQHLVAQLSHDISFQGGWIVGLGQVLDEPVAGGAAGLGEAVQVGVEVPAGDGDEFLGLQRPLIGGQGEVGDRDGVVKRRRSSAGVWGRRARSTFPARTSVRHGKTARS